MITVKIVWTSEAGQSEQVKKFNDMDKALQWCRSHYKNILWINDYCTYGEPVSHFILMDMIRGGA